MRQFILLLWFCLLCMSSDLNGQSSTGMVTPFSFTSDQGSAFVGDLVVSEESGFVNSLVITAFGSVSVNVTDIGEIIDISVFPNPTSNVLQINTDLEINIIEIFDSSGQLVAQTGYPYVDVSFLQNGSYTISINKQYALTFIKH